MQSWVVEYGTLWGLETDRGLPPFCPPRVEVEFLEVHNQQDREELAAAMNLPTLRPVEARLQSKRRCFALRVAGRIAAYGWVTQGVEQVGELERKFNLHDHEAYIWDCGTVPAWRRQRLYSALLSHIILQLHDESVSHIWIGASRLNQPSVKGFVNAGFQQVVDCTYRRLYRLSLLYIHQALSDRIPLVADAYRILINDHERRFGRLLIGYKS